MTAASGAVLDRDNTASDLWADTAYRSAANLALLERRGRKPQFSARNPEAKRCQPIRARQCQPSPRAVGSSMSSPLRNTDLGSSFALSAWHAAASVWPISPATSPGRGGLMGETRLRDGTARQPGTQNRPRRLAALQIPPKK
jgi:hypothetical protein